MNDRALPELKWKELPEDGSRLGDRKVYHKIYSLPVADGKLVVIALPDKSHWDSYSLALIPYDKDAERKASETPSGWYPPQPRQSPAWGS